MKDKRNIDELFQEGFKQFETTPPADMWDRIDAELRKKDDRKVIPLWWRWAGVAALIALLLTTGTLFMGPDGVEGDNTIVETESTSSPDVTQEEDTQNTITQPDGQSTNEAIGDVDEDDPNTPDAETDLIDRNQKAVTDPGSSNEAVAVEQVDNKVEKAADTKTTKRDPLIDTSKKVTEPVTQEAVAVEPKGKDGVEKAGQSQNTAVAEKTDVEDPVKESTTKRDPLIDTTNSIEETTAVAGADKKEEKQEIGPEKEEDVVETENTKSIFDAIAEEETLKKEEPKNRPDRAWEVTPNIGPVYYDGFGEGSAIDPVFADNGQSGDVNLTYGVQVSYFLNDRLSIRSGINNVDLGYTTDGIEIAEAPVDVALKSVDYGGRSVVLTAFDKGTVNDRPSPGQGDPYENVRLKSSGGEAQLVQDLSYFEVPMELNYALLNSRFGINMIGGFSTLILGNNEISVRDGAINEIIGEANNLNSVSFTTNIGLGFNYRINNRLKFNIEPMFKYQLNPYSDSSVDFNPYYMGVYSGLSFKF